MSDINVGKNINVNIVKLRTIADRWREANTPGNNIDLNKLADYTLKVIDNEPLIKEICQAFLYSISIHAIKDPNFDKDTYVNVERKNERKNAVDTNKR